MLSWFPTNFLIVVLTSEMVLLVKVDTGRGSVRCMEFVLWRKTDLFQGGVYTMYFDRPLLRHNQRSVNFSGTAMGKPLVSGRLELQNSSCYKVLWTNESLLDISAFVEKHRATFGEHK